MALTYIELIIATFSIILACLMAIFWSFLLKFEKVPGLDDNKFAMAFKIFIEYFSILILFLGGIGVIFQQIWGSSFLLVGAGLLFYSLINIVGEYAQLESWAIFSIFSILAITLFVITSIFIFS